MDSGPRLCEAQQVQLREYNRLPVSTPIRTRYESQTRAPRLKWPAECFDSWTAGA